MRRSTPFVLLFIVALAGCATSSSRSESPRRSGSVLGTDELRNVQQLSAYDAVRRLRPQWLRTRGPTRVDPDLQELPIRIYVNNAPGTTLDELRQIRASDIDQMRFLSAREATTRYGIDHVNGAILVTTKGYRRRR